MATKKKFIYAQDSGNIAHTSHHLVSVLLLQGNNVPVSPAFSMRFLIPAPNKSPNTVNRNNVTTSWSLGESRSDAEVSA